MIPLAKISLSEDGRLRLYPTSYKPFFEYVYREAAGVSWNKVLNCFEGQVPRQWNYKDWYKQIISVVKSGLGVHLKLSADTEFSPEIEVFHGQILEAESELQAWLAEK